VEAADAVVRADVEEVADAPLLVQAEPDVILIPALDAFGAEGDGEECKEGEQTHEKFLRVGSERMQRRFV
jgi:hypothetical protein